MGGWSRVCGWFHKNENAFVETAVVVNEQKEDESSSKIRNAWESVKNAPSKLVNSIVSGIVDKIESVLKIRPKIIAVVTVLIATLVLSLINTIGIVWLIIKTTCCK